MRQQLQTALDFYYETDKDNPFHIHRSSNAASQALVHLRNQGFILNKLSLLPNIVKTVPQEKFIELYASCIEGVCNNASMPYKNFEAIKDLVTHIEIYYRRLLINSSNAGISAHWPRVRAALMTIEDKIPKTGNQWIREYVTIRRALLQPDKKYFISQMLAKKIDTQELKKLIAYFKQQIPIDELRNSLNAQKNEQMVENIQPQQSQNQLSLQSIKRRVRMIALSDVDSDWNFLEQLYKNAINTAGLPVQDKEELDEFVKDILESYLNRKRTLEGKNGQKVRSNSLRGRVLLKHIGVVSII